MIKTLKHLRFMLMLLLATLGTNVMLGATYTINVESSTLSSDSKWYQVTNVGGVTNKTGAEWSAADYTCSPAGARTGSSNFTVRCDIANVKKIEAICSSKSARTVSGIKTGSSPSNLTAPDATAYAISGSIAKETCDQTISVEFTSALSAGTYVNFTLSGNANVHQVVLTTAASASYTLSFNANGGAGTVAEITGSGNKTLPAADAFTAPDNKEFKEWNTKNDGTGTAYAANATYDLKADATLYAIWQNKTVKSAIVYANTKEASTAALPTQYTEGVGIAEFAALADVDGFHFTGWNPSSISATATGEQTITAEWEVVVTPYFVMNYTKPSDDKVESIACTNGSVANDNAGQAFTFETNDLKFGSNNNRLLVTLDNATIVEGTKIEISWISLYNDGSKTGIGVLNENNANKTMDITNIGGASKTETGTESYTFTAVAAANYTDKFIITRNGTGKSLGLTSIKVYNVGAPVVKHTVTFDSKGGSEVPSQTVKHGEKATKPANPQMAGAIFMCWSKAGGAPYYFDDPVTEDITLEAQWIAAPPKYTVTYMDGETVLGTEEVELNQSPVNVPTPKKELNTFAGWEDAEHNPVDPASVVIKGDLTLYATWTPWSYATSVDLAAEAAGAKTAIATFLAAANIDSKIDASGAYDTNALYTGFKMKKKGDYIIFKLESGKRVKITMGYVETGVTLTINDEAQIFETSKTEVSTFTYDATADVVVKLVNNSADSKTTTLKAIEISETPAVSDDATLKTLKYDETAIDLVANKFVYNVVLPYGADVPTVTGEANSATAQSVVVTPATPENNYYATVRVTAEAGNTQDYQVRFTWNPKEGVDIIKATITSNNSATASGLYAGAVATLNSSKKLGNNGHYVKFELEAGKTFATGDILAFDVVTPNGASKIYITNAASSATENLLATLDHTFTEGMNYIVLPEAINGLTEFYLYRIDSKFNPTINSAAVQRYMAPFVKKYTIAGVEASIEGTTISAEVPFGTNIPEAIDAATVEAYANGGATVIKGTADVTVKSAYAEDVPAVYTLTITEAEHFVAQIGTTGYTTIEAAVAAATAGQTVKLLEDIDITATGLTIDKTMTLDLNGHNIKAGESNTTNIYVTGKLTVEDNSADHNGKIYTEAAYSSANNMGIVRVNGGEFILNSGNIEAVLANAADNGQFGVVAANGAKITINGGKIEAGWYAIAANGNDASTLTVVVNGGELISTADYAIYQPAKNMTTTITDGVVYGAAGAIAANAGVVTVNGGTITSKGQGSTGTWGDGTGGLADAAIVINAKYGNTSCEITGGKITAEGDAVTLKNGATYTATIAVSGGEFSQAVKPEYCAEGYAPVTTPDAEGMYTVKVAHTFDKWTSGVNFVKKDRQDNTLWTMTTSDGNGVAIVDAANTKFATDKQIDDASAKATAFTGQYFIVEFAKDMKQVELNAWRSSTTLNSGKVYVYDEDQSKYVEISYTANNSYLDPEGKKHIHKYVYGIHFEAGKTYFFKMGNAENIYDFFATESEVVTPAVTTITEVKINGVALDATELAEFIANKGITLPKKDAAFNVRATDIVKDIYDDGFEKVLATNETYTTAALEGNNFVATLDINEETYTVIAPKMADPVAKIGTATFETLAEAVAAAEAGDEIVLLADIDLTATGLTIDKEVTLDLNGHNIKAGESNTTNIYVTGKLTVEDNSADANGKIYTEAAYSSANNKGVVRVDGGEFILNSGNIEAVLADAANNGQFGVVAANGAKITINGGQIKAGWYAISANGTDASTLTVVVNGGELISTADYAIYQPAKNMTTTIKDGVVYGATGAIAANAGIVTVNGGTITSKGQGSTGTWGDGTGGLTNAAININAKYGNTTCAITGGKIIADGDAVTMNTGATYTATIAVSGGAFSSVVPAEYCAEGYEPVTTPNAQGLYEVEVIDVLTDVTGSMTWNWQDAYTKDTGAINDAILALMVAPTEKFNSLCLRATGDRASRLEGGHYYFQGTKLQMHTTVPGSIVISYRSTGSNKTINLKVNGETVGTEQGAWKNSTKAYVPAGDVVITMDGTDGKGRIEKIEFKTIDDVQVTPASVQMYGGMWVSTYCAPYSFTVEGGYAAIVRWMGSDTYVQVDGLSRNAVIPAGEGVIIVSDDNAEPARIVANCGEAPELTNNALRGTLEPTSLDDLKSEHGCTKIMALSAADAKFYLCNFAGDFPANRAFLPYSDQFGEAQAIAVRLGNMNPLPTAVENLMNSEKATKMLLNGKVVILRAGRMYDLNGHLLK